jgi:hypothetical protein
MESLKQFEWYKDPNGYRLVRVSPSGRTFFVKPADHWEDKFEKEERQPREMKIATTIYRGEKRAARPGLYIAAHRMHLSGGPPSNVATRPFDGDELVSLNLLNGVGSPKAWIEFSNRFGMLGTEEERWHLTGRDRRIFMYSVEAEGEFHHLCNVLWRIYTYYPAIRTRNADLLGRFIEWDSDGVAREKWGPVLGGMQTRPAIAMKGFTAEEDAAISRMNIPDLVAPAAFSIQDHVNRYLKDALSLEITFDQQELRFAPSLRYGSLGAALVSEAVDFMTGRFEARQCKICSSWFRIGHERMRQDRVFCSAACKMRDYRKRLKSG